MLVRVAVHVISMTEREKMLAGQLYSGQDEELIGLHNRAIELCSKLNYEKLTPEERDQTIRQLLGKCGDIVVLGRGFWCDYGTNIEVGENF